MNSHFPGCAILIPAYNPDRKLLSLVGEICDRHPAAVVVVDDGSDTKRNEIFRTLEVREEVRIHRHGTNLGKGAALKTGLTHISNNYPGVAGVVTADADGQHRAEDVFRVAAALEKEKDALILGARKFDRGVPLRSRAGNALTRIIFNLATGMSLSDTQTGLRGIPRNLVPMLQEIASSRYEYELEMLFCCLRAGIRVVEVPIETLYEKGNPSSHFDPVRDSIRIYCRMFGNIAAIIRNR